MILPILAVPPLSHWHRWAGERAGLYDVKPGIALIMLFTLFLLALVLAVAALRLRRSEAHRREARELAAGAEALRGEIEERKRVEDRLRRSEDRLREAVKVSRLGIFEHDHDSDIIYWSPEQREIYGWEPDEPVTLDKLLACSHPEDRERIAAAVRHAHDPSGDGRFDVEQRLVRRDGCIRWSVSRSQTFFEGEGDRRRAARTIGAMLDITKRKQTEAHLRQQAVALEAAANAIMITDHHAVIQWINPAFTALTGYTAEDALGKTPRLLKSGQHDSAFYKTLWDTILAGGVWRGNLVNRRKDGSLYSEEMTATPILDEQGRITHVVGIKQDISERQRLERQANRMQRLDSIGTLASGVAHDLNNTLAPIMMAVELLRMRYPEEPETVNLIEGSAQRAANMVRQLLMFAKGAEGQQVSIRPCDLVRDMETIIKSTFPKHIQLRTRVPEDLAHVLGDVTQLHQVLLNLCVNARDAMPKGGTLAIDAEAVYVDAAFVGGLHVRDAKPGRYVALRVTDTGAGIPPEALDRIFDPFFTTKGPDKGTGLGLSTVAGIVKGHGGFVQVSSQLDLGSTFTVYLPVTCGAGDTELAAKAGVHFRGNGETVLFVDDEAAVRKVARTVLGRLNFSPITATDGVDALIQTAQHRASLRAVITDLHMPHMDGLAFVRDLRRILPDTPVIVVSGRLDDDQAAEFKTLKVHLTLDKPFSEEQLVRVLRAALTSSAPPERPPSGGAGVTN